MDIEFASEAHLLMLIPGREKVVGTCNTDILVRQACKIPLNIGADGSQCRIYSKAERKSYEHAKPISWFAELVNHIQPDG